jgi:hypothetical protein
VGNHRAAMGTDIVWYEDNLMSKITAQDIENLTKATQTANQLFADLKAVESSESVLLSDAAMKLLEIVAQTEKKLKRLVMAAQVDPSASAEKA